MPTAEGIQRNCEKLETWVGKWGERPVFAHLCCGDLSQLKKRDFWRSFKDAGTIADAQSRKEDFKIGVPLSQA